VWVFSYWTVLGWAYIILHASKADFQDHLNLFSLPLGMISGNFVITPQKSFFDVCGILFGNCFFYAFVLSLLHRFGYFLIHRNRVTRMNLAAANSQSEQDDDWYDE
jgi:hypothetical protein